MMNLQFLEVLLSFLLCNTRVQLHTFLSNSWKSFSSHYTFPHSLQADSHFGDPENRNQTKLDQCRALLTRTTWQWDIADMHYTTVDFGVRMRNMSYTHFCISCMYVCIYLPYQLLGISCNYLLQSRWLENKLYSLSNLHLTFIWLEIPLKQWSILATLIHYDTNFKPRFSEWINFIKTMYLPSSHDVFFGSVVLKCTLWRSCFSSATNVKSQFPALFIRYCSKAKENTLHIVHLIVVKRGMCGTTSNNFYSPQKVPF